MSNPASRSRRPPGPRGSAVGGRHPPPSPPPPAPARPRSGPAGRTSERARRRARGAVLTPPKPLPPARRRTHLPDPPRPPPALSGARTQSHRGARPRPPPSSGDAEDGDSPTALHSAAAARRTARGSLGRRADCACAESRAGGEPGAAVPRERGRGWRRGRRGEGPARCGAPCRQEGLGAGCPVRSPGSSKGGFLVNHSGWAPRE